MSILHFLQSISYLFIALSLFWWRRDFTGLFSFSTLELLSLTSANVSISCLSHGRYRGELGFLAFACPWICSCWLNHCVFAGVLFCLDLYLCRRRTGFCFCPVSVPHRQYTHHMQSVLSNCTKLQFCTCMYSIWPPSHTHKRTQKHAHAVAQRLSNQDVRGVSQRLLLSAVTGWVLDFPSSAVVNCRRRKLLRVMVCFLTAHTGHQHSDSDFVNDVRLSQNPPAPHPTGIDAECLVPPWGSLPNHTKGVSWLPIPRRAGLFEWFKGIFHRKVISTRCRQCALQFQDHFVLWGCFFLAAAITQWWNIHAGV